MLDFVALDLADLDAASRTVPYRDTAVGCLLHGFGASANDLIGVAPAIGGARRWIFPHAPVPISVAGMSYGRAWFPRETDVLQQALFGSFFQNLRKLEPQGLPAAATAVRELLAAREVDWDTFVLGGFSQGAMVTAEILRQGLENAELPLPRAAILFSGALIAERWWTDLDDSADTDRARSVPVFQSHGRSDGILPFEEGRALGRALRQAGFTLTAVEFDGGHAIPAEVLHDVARFLDAVI